MDADTSKQEVDASMAKAVEHMLHKGECAKHAECGEHAEHSECGERGEDGGRGEDGEW